MSWKRTSRRETNEGLTPFLCYPAQSPEPLLPRQITAHDVQGGLGTEEMVHMGCLSFLPLSSSGGRRCHDVLEKTQLQTCEKAAPIFLPISCGHCRGGQEQKQSWKMAETEAVQSQFISPRGKNVTSSEEKSARPDSAL